MSAQAAAPVARLADGSAAIYRRVGDVAALVMLRLGPGAAASRSNGALAAHFCRRENGIDLKNSPTLDIGSSTMSRTIRSFADMLGLLNRGRFVEKCDEHLAEALATLEALPTEKGTATITVQVTISLRERPARHQAGDQVEAPRREGLRRHALLVA
jgi:hypothetical protein